MSVSGAYPIQRHDVVSRVVNDEAILVLPVKGEVKVLNEVGARIRCLVDGAHTVDEIAMAISSEYRVTGAEALADVRLFLDQLAEREIITWSDSPLTRGAA